MKVKILKTDSRLGITKGEIYEASNYRYDPGKITLDSREGDKYDPGCNQYKSEVAFMIRGAWMIIKNNRYIPENEVSL